MPQSLASPHLFQSLDGQLARARAVLVDPQERARARVGAVDLPLGLVVLSSGRLVVSVGDGWRWPCDEPEMAGEVYVDGRRRGQPEVRVTGWWSPLTELRSAPARAHHDVALRSTVLWLDAFEALVTDDSAHVHLTEPAQVDWLLR